MAEFVSGDTASTLALTLVDDSGAAINLTNCTVKLHWVGEDGVVVNKSMTIVSAAAGTCSYKFAAEELFASGMEFEVEVTDSNGYKLTNPDLITIPVRKRLL
jgi:hypothetical protein